MDSVFSQLCVLGSSLALITGLILLWRRGVTAYISAFTWQSRAITAVTVIVAYFGNDHELYWVAGALFILKGLVIPRLLKQMERRLAARHGVGARESLRHHQPQEGAHPGHRVSHARKRPRPPRRPGNLRDPVDRRARRVPGRPPGIPRHADLHLPDPRDLREHRRGTAQQSQALRDRDHLRDAPWPAPRRGAARHSGEALPALRGMDECPAVPPLPVGGRRPVAPHPGR